MVKQNSLCTRTNWPYCLWLSILTMNNPHNNVYDSPVSITWPSHALPYLALIVSDVHCLSWQKFLNIWYLCNMKLYSSMAKFLFWSCLSLVYNTQQTIHISIFKEVSLGISVDKIIIFCRNGLVELVTPHILPRGWLHVRLLVMLIDLGN